MYAIHFIHVGAETKENAADYVERFLHNVGQSRQHKHLWFQSFDINRDFENKDAANWVMGDFAGQEKMLSDRWIDLYPTYANYIDNEKDFKNMLTEAKNLRDAELVVSLDIIKKDDLDKLLSIKSVEESKDSIVDKTLFYLQKTMKVLNVSDWTPYSYFFSMQMGTSDVNALLEKTPDQNDFLIPVRFYY